MAPTLQGKTNQKLNNDLIYLQAQVNNGILSIHAKMEYIQEKLGSHIDEFNSTPEQFMKQF